MSTPPDLALRKLSDAQLIARVRRYKRPVPRPLVDELITRLVCANDAVKHAESLNAGWRALLEIRREGEALRDSLNKRRCHRVPDVFIGANW